MVASDNPTRPGGALCDALLDAACYPHRVTRVQRIETHISWVFLTGGYAYKVKKPVDLGFVDFTSLELRRRYCHDELRLNRRLAPELYVDVVEIRGTPEAPRIGGNGPVIEYALRMHEFPQESLASRLLASGALDPALVTKLAARIGEFHVGLKPPPQESPYGTPESVLQNAQQNFSQIEPLLESERDRAALAELAKWTERQFEACRDALSTRRAAGFVRECHGDLHLGNIVLIGGELVAFDCVEFSAALRWNDVASELAFLVMDLIDRGAPELAWSLLTAYLETTADYGALPVLRFYLVYRALVRAKVHLMRASQDAVPAAERERLSEAYREYIALATRCTDAGRPGIVLMHGFSGCGKSTVARALVEALGAIGIRSDVERKRIHGLVPAARSGSAVGSGLYTADATDATYARLGNIALAIAGAGYTAVVDAAFLGRAERAHLRAISETAGVPLVVLDIRTPPVLLRERIAQRRRSGGDPSEATLEVLEHQLRNASPIQADEKLTVFAVDGDAMIPAHTLERIARALGAPAARR